MFGPAFFFVFLFAGICRRKNVVDGGIFYPKLTPRFTSWSCVCFTGCHTEEVSFAGRRRERRGIKMKLIYVVDFDASALSH